MIESPAHILPVAATIYGDKCVTPERTVDECMALMTDKRSRHLPVVENKQVIGVISTGV